MRRGVSSIAALAIGWGAACSSFSGAPTPPASDSGVDDAGRANDGGGTTDDGGAPVDGSAPACLSTRVLEEHFNNLLGPWTFATTGDSGVSHDPAQSFETDGGSLRAEVTAGAEATQAQISRAFLGVPSAVTLTFGMRLRALAASAYGEAGCTLQLLTDLPDTWLQIRPEIKGDALKVDEDGQLNNVSQPGGSSVPAATLTAEPQWFALQVELRDITASKAHLTIRVGQGPNALDRDVTIPAQPTGVRVKCGIDGADLGTAMVVNVDDVVLTVCR